MAVEFAVYSLAAMRLARMLADEQESGPFRVLDKAREKAGVTFDKYGIPIAERGTLADGITCVYCSSLWIGAALALLHAVSPKLAIVVSLPLAINGVVTLREELFK